MGLLIASCLNLFTKSNSPPVSLKLVIPWYKNKLGIDVARSFSKAKCICESHKPGIINLLVPLCTLFFGESTISLVLKISKILFSLITTDIFSSNPSMGSIIPTFSIT